MKISKINMLVMVLGISVIMIMLTSASIVNLSSLQSLQADDPSFVIPDSIQVILDKSCLPCHGSESSNFMAKSKIRLDELTELSGSKLVSKLSKISNIIGKGKMPPDKFIKKNPDNAPTKKELDVLKQWADKNVSDLMP